MNRAKVVVHMYVSIDGKIDGEYHAPTEGQVSSAYYSEELFRISNADGNGRKTIQMYAAPNKLDLTSYDGSQLEYEDWVPDLKSDTWAVSFDRRGQAGWDTNYFDYGGHRMHAVEVVTKQVSLDYLAFLRSMKIPYVICGDEDLDLAISLEKLRRYFKIETLALCGGAMINGAFLKEGLIDEISLVVAPYVSGNPQEQTAFNTLGNFVDDRFAIEQAKPLANGGVHLIYKKQKD